MRRRFLMIGGGVLVMAAAGAAVLHHERRPPPCPSGYQADEGRRSRVRSRLYDALARFRTLPDASLLARAWNDDHGAWCFGPSSELREPDGVLLDARLGDGEAAARAAHLLLHALVAPPWAPAPAATCEERVRRALGAEARAISLELELREALLPPTATPVERYAFEAEHRASPPAARIGMVETLLARNPDGAAGIPPLADMYAARCRAETAVGRR